MTGRFIMSDKQFHSKSILCKIWGKFLKLTVRYILKSILVGSLFLFVTLNLIDCFFQNLWFCEKCLVFHRVYPVWFTTTSFNRFWVKLRMTFYGRKFRNPNWTKMVFCWTLNFYLSEERIEFVIEHSEITNSWRGYL